MNPDDSHGDAKSTSSAEQPEHEYPFPEGSLVLVVEDNDLDAELIRRMLRATRPDFELKICRNLEEASKVEGVDVVLLDLGLPGSFGIETFHRARELWEDLPLIVLSGLADMRLAKMAVEAGAQDYIVKGRINGPALRRTLLYSVERNRVAQERQRLIRELERSRRLEAIGQLAAGVAHEINTPTQYVSDNMSFLHDSVNVLLAMVKEIRTAAEGGEPITPEFLAALLEKADADFLEQELPAAVTQSLEGLERIAVIVQAMREFSHPPKKKKVSSDLRQSLETTIVVASSEWRFAAEMTTDIEENLPRIECFPGEMNQVFLNLIVNAAHAVADTNKGTPNKGTIEVGARTLDEDWIEVWVQDSGTGVPEQHQDQLFEPFFTTKEVGRGTGQGLAIAYDVVVRRHGGRLLFETEDGKGTRFLVQLPRRSAVTQAA